MSADHDERLEDAEAIEIVRKIHSKVCRDGYHVDCASCPPGTSWPCPTLKALGV